MRWTVLLGCLLMLLTACGGSGGGGEDKPKSAAKQSPSASATPEPEPEPVMLGTQRYVSPCRVFDQDDVVAVYGDPGRYAYFDQEFVEKSKSPAEMRSIGQTIGAKVDTSCRYVFDDKGQTAVDVTVDQYPTPQAALKKWRQIKKLGSRVESRQLEKESGVEWLLKITKEIEASQGGVPVRELDPTILFVAGKTQFTGIRRNLLITVSRKSYAGNFFSPKGLKGALSTTGEAFKRIYARLDAAEPLDQAPAPAFWEQTPRWPRFLEPCAIFDDEVMVGVSGHSTTKVTSHSVTRTPAAREQRNVKPGDQAVYNQCERNARIIVGKQRTGFGIKSASWNGRAELVYGAPGDTGTPLLEGVMLRRFFTTESKAKYSVARIVKEGYLKPVEIEGADGAYEFSNTYQGDTFGWIAANVGPYVVVFDAGKYNEKKLGSDQVSQALRLEAVSQIVANIKKAAAPS